MAGYRTRTSWAAPDIEFDSEGQRIFPSAQTAGMASFELCRAPGMPGAIPGQCLKRCGEKCEWGGKG